MKRLITILAAAMAVWCTAASANPKREFRGAWMHTVYQGQYASQSTQENKQYLRRQLDLLRQAGVNAVLFQVRPSADAFYDSPLEPWSRFLTSGGHAPRPYWDPLQFMVEEAHARGMELHAWINPYRVTTSKTEKLPPGHIYHRDPWRFLVYEGDGRMYFDPGQPANRTFIARVVRDIVDRYDVDGIHFDDYFYPYPGGGKDFPDDVSYATYGEGQDRGDWRRANVDALIEMVHDSIRASDRPWVRFGVSPFGIYRNKSHDPSGSKTSGLQNYDDLYADVLLWAERGWIDYLIPQLYWELEHKRASTLELARWWDNMMSQPQYSGCQLYLGQDLKKCVDTPDIDEATLEPLGPGTDQLQHKIDIARRSPSVSGLCWWPGYVITDDYKGVAGRLAQGSQSTRALVPAYTDLAARLAMSRGGGVAPAPVRDLAFSDGLICWNAPAARGYATDAVSFVVYRFPQGAQPDFDDPTAIVAVTAATSYTVDAPGDYYVTTLDHLNVESEPRECFIRQR